MNTSKKFFLLSSKITKEKKIKKPNLVLFKNKTKLGNCTMDKNLKKV